MSDGKFKTCNGLFAVCAGNSTDGSTIFGPGAFALCGTYQPPLACDEYILPYEYNFTTTEPEYGCYSFQNPPDNDIITEGEFQGIYQGHAPLGVGFTFPPSQGPHPQVELANEGDSWVFEADGRMAAWTSGGAGTNLQNVFACDGGGSQPLNLNARAAFGFRRYANDVQFGQLEIFWTGVITGTVNWPSPGAGPVSFQMVTRVQRVAVPDPNPFLYDRYYIATLTFNGQQVHQSEWGFDSNVSNWTQDYYAPVGSSQEPYPPNGSVTDGAWTTRIAARWE